MEHSRLETEVADAEAKGDWVKHASLTAELIRHLDHGPALQAMYGIEEEETLIGKPTKIRSVICHNCNGRNTIINDDVHAHTICTQCGITVDHTPEGSTFHQSHFYNRPTRVPYCPKEHFARYVGDVLGTSSRSIPDLIMMVCRTQLQEGCTPDDVYDVIKLYGKPNYYVMRWRICYSINGRTPFKRIRTDEYHRLMKLFRALLKYIQDYQVEYSLVDRALGKRKQRMYFPYRFILTKLLVHMGRNDAAQVVPGVMSEVLMKAYEFHWKNIWNRFENNELISF